MNKIIVISAAMAALALSGCRSVSVLNKGQDYVRDQDGKPVLVDGKPVVYSLGWDVKQWQHWMTTHADQMSVSIKPDEITFDLNGLDSKPDSDGLSKLVEKALSGAAELAAKIGAAVASSGGTVGLDAVASYVKQFMSKGGDPSKATVTISDGVVTCTDGSCTYTAPCSDGSCSYGE